MASRIIVLDADPHLRPVGSVLRRVIQAAVRRTQSVLPLERQRVDMVVRYDPQSVIPEQAIGVYTPNSNLILISVDPGRGVFRRKFRLALPRTIAHELHHAVRWMNPGYGKTLGEAIVTEGLTAHFELEVFGGRPNPWDVALPKKLLNG